MLSVLMGLLAQSALHAPIFVPEQAATWREMPADALRLKQSVAARVEVVIRPDGSIEKCSVLETVGPAAVARRLCPAQRPRTWKAAVGSDGAPAYGVVREWVRFVVPESLNQNRVSAIEDPVDAVVPIPPGSHASADHEFKVSVEIDVRGVPVACSAPQDAELADLACATALKIPDRAVEVQNLPLPSYVIARTIRFTG